MATDRAREPLRGAFIAILAAAIAAGGTLLGSQLANANARQQLSAQLSHEDRVRQDEARNDAYANFISAASQYELDLETVAAITAEKGLSVKDFKELTGDAGRLLTAAAEVQVVGSVKAVSLAKVVRKDLDDILNSGLSNRLSPEDITSRANANERKLIVFAGSAHDELNK
jgi:hypothetical protein